MSTADEPPMDPALEHRLAPYLAGDRATERGILLRGAAVLLLVTFSLYFTGFFDPQRVSEGVPALIQIGGEMLPPDFSRWRAWIKPTFDTLAMSIGGTAISVVLSLAIAFFAAVNTTPHSVVYRAARLVLNALRAIPELILGILFVAAVGFGALPGVLALGLHSAGMVGKFFAEAIEHADPKPIEAARAAGATPMQVIWHAILPQVMPQMADVTVYRWEYNFRASTVMGAVGAGGIGFELMGSLRIMDYQQVSAILLCILLCVTLVDGIGGWVRRRLV